MCPCESHWDSTRLCTCDCTLHEERLKAYDNTNTHTGRPESD
jgi:hypothetical protein